MLGRHSESLFPRGDFRGYSFAGFDISGHRKRRAQAVPHQRDRHGQCAASACVARANVIIGLPVFHFHRRLDIPHDPDSDPVAADFVYNIGNLLFIDLSAYYDIYIFLPL